MKNHTGTHQLKHTMAIINLHNKHSCIGISYVVHSAQIIFYIFSFFLHRLLHLDAFVAVFFRFIHLVAPKISIHFHLTVLLKCLENYRICVEWVLFCLARIMTMQLASWLYLEFQVDVIELHELNTLTSYTFSFSLSLHICIIFCQRVPFPKIISIQLTATSLLLCRCSDCTQPKCVSLGICVCVCLSVHFNDTFPPSMWLQILRNDADSRDIEK